MLMLKWTSKLVPVLVLVLLSSDIYNVFHLYLQDICRCSVFYADEMSEKVEGMGESQNVYEKKFEVTNEVRDIYYFMF
jgi:hypothetical protein